MTLISLTPAQVLAGHPSASGKPYYLREHDGGLAMPAGDNAWLHATPNADGTWTSTGYLGPIGDKSTCLFQDTVCGPDPLYASFAAAAGTEADGAFGIISALAEDARYVRISADLRDLLTEFPALDIHSWGGMCPVQAEGTLHGYPFYFRYRHAYATLTVGGDLHWQSLWSSGTEYGEEDQGWLDTPAFAHLMRTLIRDLTRAPMWWGFEGVRTTDRSDVPADQLRDADRAGAPTKMGGWGHTPAEAWERLHSPENLYKVTPEQWARHVAEHGLSAQTITTDEREYPHTDPIWDAPPA